MIEQLIKTGAIATEGPSAVKAPTERELRRQRRYDEWPPRWYRRGNVWVAVVLWATVSIGAVIVLTDPAGLDPLIPDVFRGQE